MGEQIYSLGSSSKGIAQEVLEVLPRRPNFETGVSFPQWGPNAYGPDDRDFAAGLTEITKETGARWIALTLNFTQAFPTSTSVETAHMPTPSTFAAGIHAAHRAGFSVFVQPLISIRGPNAWAGYIQFTREEDAATWFMRDCVQRLLKRREWFRPAL
jgi:hypothetical protein